MSGPGKRPPATPPAEVAAVYTPLARAYLAIVGAYYAIVAVLHPAYRTGPEIWSLTATAGIAAVVCLGLAWRLRRPANLGLLELAILTGNLFILSNVLLDQALSFEEHQLLYQLLMALCFATGGPTRRVAYPSVAVALGAFLALAPAASPMLRDNAGFLALATGFVALGISYLMRGALLRELRARLAAEALNDQLKAELDRNETLRRTADELALRERAANRTKTEFLATITHELRTPLNGVLGMAQVMALDDLPDHQRERLDVIRASGSALLATINDVLDIANIETGRLALAPADFDLGRLVDDLGSLYAALAAEKDLDFRIFVDPAARDWRSGDEVRLRQVLSNLLSNALKFTEEGAVSVYVRCEGERVRFSVADTGVGVRADQAATLFEAFVQADGGATRRFGGVGLGLSISRELVALMGGDIDFTSAAGEGSCFTFQVPLPRARGDRSGELGGAMEDLSRLRVLAADDNETNRIVVRTLLEGVGVSVDCAVDGDAAIAAWEVAPYDLILMDIHMPGRDGVAAAAEIRARERAAGRARTPIIALTASVLPGEQGRYAAAGMDGCIPKPVELARLIEALRSLSEAQPQAIARAV